MKNLINELLLKLAQKEEESQDLAAQVETLERVITEILSNMTKSEQQMFLHQIEEALEGVSRMPAFLTAIHSSGEGAPKTF